MVEHKIPRLKRFIIYYLMCLFILFPINPSWGSNVLISGNDSSVYQKNSTTIVNIATPNENGISHNKYQQFNVLEKGIILNNSKNTVKTQLAGDINGNNRLREINAELIINEVVGNSQSQLLGKLEVAGKSANVIIANPNGITCNGCSFINVPALTLTTGKPFLGSDGQLSAIEVKKGTITIGNKGMNAETPNYTDIISQAMVQLKGKMSHWCMGIIVLISKKEL
nr:filamentous hemagglutinin N-terminal domain-containing protein [Providencia rettgeri]